ACTPEEPSGAGKVANFELPKRNTGPYFSKIIATEADAPGIFLGFGGGLPHETARLLDLRSPVAAAPRRSGIRTGARSASGGPGVPAQTTDIRRARGGAACHRAGLLFPPDRCAPAVRRGRSEGAARGQG